MDKTRALSDSLRARRGALALCALVALACGAFALPAAAGDSAPFEARSGVEIASEAAHTWAPDAVLVWVENDEAPDARGAAGRWGYLYYSPGTEKARAYSVREGRILVAENLDMKFDAPQLAGEWIDSGAAFAAAEEARGLEFRNRERGQLRTMVLTRGTMDSGDPDRTTWTLVYGAPQLPSLFVVVDASSGKVLRTWRG